MKGERFKECCTTCNKRKDYPDCGGIEGGGLWTKPLFRLYTPVRPEVYYANILNYQGCHLWFPNVKNVKAVE